jgi:hypothetical protein
MPKSGPAHKYSFLFPNPNTNFAWCKVSSSDVFVRFLTSSNRIRTEHAIACQWQSTTPSSHIYLFIVQPSAVSLRSCQVLVVMGDHPLPGLSAWHRVSTLKEAATCKMIVSSYLNILIISQNEYSPDYCGNCA